MPLRGKELIRKIREAFPPMQAEVLEELFDFLDELVKVHDFNELKAIVAELALAHRDTQKELKELALAQKRTEERVEELALAQKKTEEEIRLLTKEVKKIKDDLENVKDHLGALANTVGYTLENEAYKYLPALLKKHYQIEVTEELKRDFVEIAPEKYIEINIIGKAKKEGREILIVGESKVQPKISHINEFLEKLKKIRKIFSYELFPVLVCHQIHPKVRSFCQERGIAIFLSYQFS